LLPRSNLLRPRNHQLHLPQPPPLSSLQVSNLASRLGLQKRQIPMLRKKQLLLPRSQLNLRQKPQRHHLHQQFQASPQVSNLASRLELLKRQIPMLRKKPLRLRPRSQLNLRQKPRQHHLHQQHRASLQVSNLALKPELLKALPKPTNKSSTFFTIPTIDRGSLSTEKPNANLARA